MRRIWTAWRLWAAVSLIAAISACVILQTVQREWHDREAERASLYWNGYAGLYVRSHGGWAGLQAELDQSGYTYAGDAAFAFRAYAADADRLQPSAAVAAIGKAGPGGHRLPVLLDGEIVGWTETALPSSGRWSVYSYTIAAALGLLIFGIGVWFRRRLETADKAAEERKAASLAAYMREVETRLAAAGEDGVPVPAEAAGSTEKESAAWKERKDEIASLMRRNHRLETIRRTMVADIAHELRTPLAVMRASLENALQSGDPLAPQKAARLYDETLRLTRLVRELQQLSQAESGHLPLSKTWFPLRELAEEVLETMAAESGERGVTTTVTGFGEATVYADRGRVRQIIINLLGNAFRHARSQVNVNISLEESVIALTVSDDGNGIEEEELERVFDRFYRGPESQRTEGRERGTGLGLGLAIVRGFARAHGGEARAYSQFGKGVSFKVTLPVMKD